MVKKEMKGNLSRDIAYVIKDFKIKYTPIHYRETSQEHFGKRRMNWNGFMIQYQPVDYDPNERMQGREREDFESEENWVTNHFNVPTIGETFYITDAFMKACKKLGIFDDSDLDQYSILWN